MVWEDGGSNSASYPMSASEFAQRIEQSLYFFAICKQPWTETQSPTRLFSAQCTVKKRGAVDTRT